MEDGIPDIFVPVAGVLGENDAVYRKINPNDLSAWDKVFLAKEMLGETSFLPRTGLELTALQLTARYGISKQTLSSYKVKYEDTDSKLCGKRGRPKALDEQADQQLKEWLQERVAIKKPATVMETTEMVAELRGATAFRQNKQKLEDADQIISARGLRDVKKRNKVRNRAPQRITEARMRALINPALHYRQACSVLAFADKLSATNKWNADSTGLLVHSDGHGELVCTVLERGKPDPVTSSTTPDDIGIFIKWMHLCNAAGDGGPLVLIYAVSDMPEGEFFHFRVPGLSGETNAVGQFGHIYICKTRAGNAAMWAHWFEEVAIPTMRNSNAFYAFKVSLCSLLY
jgi:transposase